MQNLRETFKYSNRRYKSIGRTIEDSIKKEFPYYEYGDNDIQGYRTLRIKDQEHWVLASKLFEFLGSYSNAFDDTLQKRGDNYIFQLPVSKELYDIIYFTKEAIYIGNTEGYKESEKESDIKDMTNDFISVVSDFLPIKQLPIQDQMKLRQLYREDVENGNLNCDVYMGNTD